jgi:hypothetical protein
MQNRASNLLALVIVLATVVIPALIEVAFAFDVTPVPAPVAAIGLPALVVYALMLGGGYWLVRKLRARRPSD